MNPHQYAESAAIHFFQIDSAIFQRQFCRCHCKVGIAVASPDIFRIFKVRLWVETPHFSGDMAVIGRRVELCYLTDAAFSLNQIPPERFQVVSNRRNYSDAGNNYASIAHGIGRWLANRTLDCGRNRRLHRLRRFFLRISNNAAIGMIPVIRGRQSLRVNDSLGNLWNLRNLRLLFLTNFANPYRPSEPAGKVCLRFG